MKKNQHKTIAIVGCGPRGLYALEQLLLALSDKEKAAQTNIICIERTNEPGSGQVYFTKQSTHNWMNVCSRELQLQKRNAFKFANVTITEFPSFLNWLAKEKLLDCNKNIDFFPDRKTVGKYLHERFITLLKDLKNHTAFQHINNHVTSITYTQQFCIEFLSKETIHADMVLLTVGHQPAENDAQIEKWIEHAKTHSKIQLFEDAYPIAQLHESNLINNTTSVAIRGFGLTMFDVIRSLAIDTGGKFVITDSTTLSMKFTPGINTPKKIIPFSLNGLPMQAKPINEQIDNQFIPSENQTKKTVTSIQNSLKNDSEITSLNFLIHPMAMLIIEVFSKFIKDNKVTSTKSEQLEIVKKWIKNEAIEHPLLTTHNQPTLAILKEYVGMATGKLEFSLDYCIGQVWRHMHPTLYKLLSHTQLPPTVMNSIIELDARLKRITFGPPVKSLQQLIALIEAGVLTVKAIDDPDIKTTADGWLLDAENKDFTAQIMINTVLPAPNVAKISSSLFKTLLKEKYIEIYHKNLGVKIDKFGKATTNNKEKTVPLYVIGRSTLGSVFGVDAIAEAFGNRVENCVKEMVKSI